MRGHTTIAPAKSAIAAFPTRAAEEARMLAGIRRGRADVASGKVRTHEAVSQELKSWAAQWNAK